MCCSVFIHPCQEIPLEFQKDGQMVIFSGSNIPSCRGFHPYYTCFIDTTTITSIRKVDTLYQNGSLTIKIIKTEDFGLAPGFGYEINYPEKDFFIRQTRIATYREPKPFFKKEDALKIAFLIAAKLKRSDEFPNLFLNEVAFLEL